MNFVATICIMAALVGPALSQVLMCYFASWATYRIGNGNFEVSNIEPELCTHHIYAFVDITSEGDVGIIDSWNDLPDGGGKDNMARFTSLKYTATAPKVLVSIGGWNAGSTNFSIVVNDDTLRATFVSNVVNFLRNHNFDGADLNWILPNQDGEHESDVENFAALVRELKEAFNEDGFLLTASVAATEDLAAQSYDIPALSEYLDYINVMTYELTTADGSDVVIHHTEMHSAGYQANDEYLLHNTVEASINFWIASGAPASKIVLGIPLYARTYTLADVSQTEPGSPSIGPGNTGPYTAGDGTLGYNELCELQLNGDWTTVWSEELEEPYTYSGDQWAGYDNERSIEVKVNFALEHELAGVMFWSIDTDDFRGICGDTTYPLLNAANAALFKTTHARTHHHRESHARRMMGNVGARNNFRNTNGNHLKLMHQMRQA